MSTITTGQERLRTLYAVMWGVEEDLVDLKCWRGSDNEASDQRMLSCNTVGCAVGWACSYPEFQSQGLRYSPNRAGPILEVDGEEPLTEFTAVAEFFGMSLDDAESMFVHPRYTKQSEPDLNDKQTVLRRIRRYLMNTGAITKERNAELAREEGSPE